MTEILNNLQHHTGLLRVWTEPSIPENNDYWHALEPESSISGDDAHTCAGPRAHIDHGNGFFIYYSVHYIPVGFIN